MGLLPSGGGWWRPPGTAAAASGTHPTGMHSCLLFDCKVHLDLDVRQSTLNKKATFLWNILI